METLSFFGVGPKIGKSTLPYFAATIAMTIIFPRIFTFGDGLKTIFLVAGVILIVFALIFYFSTLRLMLPAIRQNRLVTTGAYRLCRNPLYSALIVFFIPGLGLLLNSWIIITSSVIGYLVFRRNIHEEEEMLERIFGDEYRAYKAGTPQLFPDFFRTI